MPSIYALKRKHKKLQEEYDLKSEELRRLRKAHTIETDPSQKFKFENQIEQLEERRKQLGQELEELEYLFDHPEEIPPFQWDYSKFPINFSSKIEFLIQYFVGKQEAIEKIEQFIQTHKSGYLAIVGEAGIGKSALLAHEVKVYSAVHHFVDDKQNSAKDEVFLRSIVEQLRQKYGFEFEERMPISVIEWNIYFHKWMKEISAEEKLVIFVDALDEAQLYGGQDSLLKYLPNELPENIYFILTSRPKFKKEDITFLDSTVFERYDLPPLTQADIEAYLTQRFPSFLKGGQGGFSDVPSFSKGGPGGISGGLSEIAAILYQKSEGNPLYLYYLLQECDDENLTMEQVNQLPQGLMKFYEKQWHERIWTGDKATKEGRKQILCLLLILKEPPDGEMLLKLTDFDRAELQEYLKPLRRFMRTGERYEIFHNSFKNFLQTLFEKTLAQEQAKIVDHLWHWQRLNGQLRLYVLAWLPNHLFEAQQHERLFALAMDGVFQQAQTQALPDEPNVALRTLQTALQAAADVDNAAAMAKFLLVHAHHITQLLQENPLETLRNGNLERAWELADLYDIERCVQWYLLLAWELQDSERLEEARKTLIRLRKKNLPLLNFKDKQNAAYLLTQIAKIDDYAFSDLCQRLLNDDPMILCAFFEYQRFSSSIISTKQTFSKEERREKTLREILDRQTHTDDVTTALAKAKQITNEWEQAGMFQGIAAIQGQKGEYTAARTTLSIFLATGWQNSLDWARRKALLDNANIYLQNEDAVTAQIPLLLLLAEILRLAIAERSTARYLQAKDVTAQTTEQQITHEDAQRALPKIAVAQAQSGKIAAAMETVQQIDIAYGGLRSDALQGIAMALAQRGDLKAALVTAQQIPIDWVQVEVLADFAFIYAQSGDIATAQATFDMAFAIAKSIADEKNRATAFVSIAISQAKAGFPDKALQIAELILVERDYHFLKIADIFVEVGDREYFKRLLIPCAFYLDAAYHMCGLLARLYPEQATAIAEGVMKQGQQKRNVSEEEQTV